MLRSWLGPAMLHAFERAREQRRAYALPRVAPLDPSPLDWTVLDVVLRREPAPDVLVVARNRLLALAAPRSEQEVRALFAQRSGLVVRHAQDTHPRLAALARAFEREFAARAHIQLFVTPGQSHGFGWHYDLDDVIIVQTVGQKDYYFRDNTVGDIGARPPDFGAIERETSPLLSCRLLPGDVLYLPRGMWHVARACEDSMHISLGLEPPRPARA